MGDAILQLAQGREQFRFISVVVRCSSLDQRGVGTHSRHQPLAYWLLQKVTFEEFEQRERRLLHIS